ncbi:AraC family transcriptional regulator [Paenibacillus mesophilus]
MDEEAGCASTHRFHSLFKKKPGMTPNEYRSRQQTGICHPES